MADTTTTNYGLTKVEVGASDGTWGAKLNVNADAIDAQLKLNADAAAAAQSTADDGVSDAAAAQSTADGALVAANNFSDVASNSTARSNLGLGSASTQATSSFATAGQGTLADDALPLASVLDQDDFADDSATLPASQQSTKAYIAAQPLSAEYTSDEKTTPASGSIRSVVHGLGGVPSLFTVSLRCETTDLGYAVGDEIILANHEGSGTRSLTTYANATNVSMTWTSGIYVSNLSGAGAAPINTASWKLVFRAWL